MALQFQGDTTTLDLVKGIERIDRQVPFQGTVKDAQVVLKGFKLEFATTDTPTKVMEVSLHNVRADGNDVRFRVVTQLKDKTGLDEYSGFVDVLVIADVV
jgi:hypothetical protein